MHGIILAAAVLLVGSSTPTSMSAQGQPDLSGHWVVPNPPRGGTVIEDTPLGREGYIRFGDGEVTFTIAGRSAISFRFDRPAGKETTPARNRAQWQAHDLILTETLDDGIVHVIRCSLTAAGELDVWVSTPYVLHGWDGTLTGKVTYQKR